MSGSNRIELWNGASKLGVIAQNQPAYMGDYSWKIGEYNGGTAPAGNGYRIKIVNGNGPEDASDNPFTLMPGMEKSGPGLGDSVQRFQASGPQGPNMVNPQIVSYATINSFTVNGQVNTGNEYIECRLSQGLLCQTSAFSQTQPILYRYLLNLEDTIYSQVHHVFTSPWIPQADFTINMAQDAVIKAVYPNHLLDGHTVPQWHFGSVVVEVKNATQAEAPKTISRQIKLMW